MKSLKILAMFAVALAVGMFAFEVAAQTNVFQTSIRLMSGTFKNVRVIVYVLGAFGLIGLAIGGIMGAIKWKWLGMLACGLGIIAVADGVVNYAMQGATTGNITEDVSNETIDF